MAPIRPIKMVSVSPSGNYRVGVVRLPDKGDDEFDNSHLLLLDRGGKTLLNLSPTNKRHIDVIWRRDEKAVIVNNCFAMDGDWLVYVQETKPGQWVVRRSSSDFPRLFVRKPAHVLRVCSHLRMSFPVK